MHHTQALQEIMIINNITTVALGKRLGMTHVGVLHRMKSKTGGLRATLQMVEAMGYEIVIRPRTDGDLPEGEYALRPTDYSFV